MAVHIVAPAVRRVQHDADAGAGEALQRQGAEVRRLRFDMANAAALLQRLGELLRAGQVDALLDDGGLGRQQGMHLLHAALEQRGQPRRHMRGVLSRLGAAHNDAVA
ncbi:hypothetical protein D3C86_2029350 [compost metagenome]